MYATIGLAVGERRVTPLVPQAALQEMDGQTVIFVESGECKFEKRAVKTGRRQGDMVEVLEGLSRGERVVTEGGFLLKSEFSKEKLAEDQ
jgi:cobalt-zinc-cadmium efflux system membrane fusion protein